VTSGPIALNDLSWNAAAGIDLDAIGLSPCPDSFSVDVAS
jgi:hypothetical protein